ncbi:malate synthase A [Rossellomorea marisflavi]|uniref:malate synthase A n=1 Tax=Rossellomorea marisflavi TaxID=189381 RepID=UPI003D2EC3E5
MDTKVDGMRIKGEESYKEILTDEALGFLEQLERRFGQRRKELLEARENRQKRFDEGESPDFLNETEHIRKLAWKVDELPEALKDRRVEITGPVDRKMMINALNSGAKCFMACLEDATSPTWQNVMEGQINLRDAVDGSIRYSQPGGKEYRLNGQGTVLIVRPRGMHLEEKHIELDGEPLSAGLVDFGLHLFHSGRKLAGTGRGPFFYLPKLESHQEARFWNDVFVFSQEAVGLPKGTIKATVLIETITAAFEMDEILYELKEHSAGLNCGRWDYIFSYIKKFRTKGVLPDRSTVTMTAPFMRAYSLLTIKTCHRRGAPAIGGMAAQIPIKGDPAKNEEAFRKVRQDKEREARDGHDGTWVAHPGLVQVAKDVFDGEMPGDNQIADKRLTGLQITAEDLLQLPDGEITEEGVRLNINVGIRYVSAWLKGQGAVPINHLMEDAATAEISRAQLWQWIRHPDGVLADGRKLTMELYEAIKQEELTRIKEEFGTAYEEKRIPEAVELFDELIRNDRFEEFLTLKGYEIL